MDPVKADKAATPLRSILQLMDTPTRPVITQLSSMHAEAVRAVGVDRAMDWRNDDNIGYEHLKTVLMWKAAVFHDKEAENELHRLHKS